MNMESGFQIDLARPEDAAALLDYLEQIGGETDNLTFGGEGLPFSEQEEARHLGAVLDSADDIQLVVRLDGRIVADASLHRMPRRMHHRAELGISVARDYWGRGIGSALMEKLIAFARQQGIRQLELQVRSDNARAIGLYEKFGFRKLCRFPAFFRMGETDVDFDLMNLTLTE